MVDINADGRGCGNRDVVEPHTTNVEDRRAVVTGPVREARNDLRKIGRRSDPRIYKLFARRGGDRNWDVV